MILGSRRKAAPDPVPWRWKRRLPRVPSACAQHTKGGGFGRGTASRKVWPGGLAAGAGPWSCSLLAVSAVAQGHRPASFSPRASLAAIWPPACTASCVRDAQSFLTGAHSLGLPLSVTSAAGPQASGPAPICPGKCGKCQALLGGPPQQKPALHDLGRSYLSLREPWFWLPQTSHPDQCPVSWGGGASYRALP